MIMITEILGMYHHRIDVCNCRYRQENCRIAVDECVTQKCVAYSQVQVVLKQSVCGLFSVGLGIMKVVGTYHHRGDVCSTGWLVSMHW